MKKFAVILSGCGVYDGAEIHESVLIMLAISKYNSSYSLFAPDIDQHHVINHLNGEVTSEKRNVLVESARIARGNIQPLSLFKPEDFDALIFPGGYGISKNLCTYAFDGPNCSVNPEIENAVRAIHALGKPIGAVCIAPAMIARILGDVELTIGQDKDTAAHVVQMGAKHIPTNPGDVIIDKRKKVFSTPCYMLDSTILQIAEGAENIVKSMLNYM